MPSARLMNGTKTNYAPAVIDGPSDRLSDTLRVDISGVHGVGFLGGSCGRGGSPAARFVDQVMHGLARETVDGWVTMSSSESASTSFALLSVM